MISVPTNTLESFGPVLGFFVWWIWQVYAPKLLDRDTALSSLIELPERVEEVEERTSRLTEKVEDIDKKQVHHIQVTRANARALDEEKNVSISSDEVDDYLVDNGVPVAVFTTEPPNKGEA